LLRGISFDKPIKIVELGCGTGYHTLQMTRMYPVAKVTMVDFNADVIEDTGGECPSSDAKRSFCCEICLTSSLMKGMI